MASKTLVALKFLLDNYFRYGMGNKLKGPRDFHNPACDLVQLIGVGFPSNREPRAAPRETFLFHT